MVDTPAKTLMEQFALLRTWSEKSGGLHEAQAQQIKLWPRVLFSTSTKSTACLNFKDKRLEYTVQTSSKESDAENTSKVLSEWTKSMLGNNWTILVHVVDSSTDQKETFESPAGKNP